MEVPGVNAWDAMRVGPSLPSLCVCDHMMALTPGWDSPWKLEGKALSSVISDGMTVPTKIQHKASGPFPPMTFSHQSSEQPVRMD